jgi:hypothetical protein
VQLYVLHAMPDPTVFQYVSVIISIATTALTIASIDYGLSTDRVQRAFDPEIFGIVPDMGDAQTYIFGAMIFFSLAQMTATVLGTVSLAHIDPWIAVGAWGGKLAMLFAVKLARRDFYYHAKQPTVVAIVVAAFIRPGMMLVSDLGLLAYARHPNEMGCGLWWFGKLWPWLLLSVAIGLRANDFGSAALHEVLVAAAPLNTSANFTLNSTLNSTLTTVGAGEQSPLADPVVLSVMAAVLLATWLLSFAVFFSLANPACRPSFWRFETAAEYQKRVKWDGQADERKRAKLLVNMHPPLLRLIAPEAHIWIEANWDKWTSAPPIWFTDDWKRQLPDSVLSQQTLMALGGQSRRRTTVAEELELMLTGNLTAKAATDASARRAQPPEVLPKAA